MKIFKYKETANLINPGTPLDGRIGLMRGGTNIIGLISERMDADGEFEVFDSIADIWFHARSYELAFLNGQLLTAFERDYEKRWRVIFASLCLHLQLGVEIVRERIDLTGKDSTLQGIAKTFLREGSHFGEARKNIEGFSWNTAVRWYIPAGQDGQQKINIAYSSPSVILVPAPDAFDELKKHIKSDKDGKKIAPWFDIEDDEEFILDENDVPHMHKAQATNLAQFIHDYRRYLLGLCNRDELNEVQIMLLGPIGAGQSEPGLLKRFEDDLIKTYKLGKMSNDVFSKFCDIADITIKSNMDIFQSDFTYFAADHDSIKFELSDYGKIGDRTVNETNLTFWAPIPLTELGFEKLSPLDFSVSYREVKYREDAALEIESLTLEISTKSGETYSKSYAGYGIRIHMFAQDEICQVGIWPKKNIKGWKQYYLATQLRETRLTAQKNIIQGYEPLVNNKPHKSASHTVYKMDQMPEYLRAFNIDNVTLGYVRIKKDEFFYTGGEDVFCASIDLGTSSTVVYIKNGNTSQPEKLSEIKDIEAGSILTTFKDRSDFLRCFLLPNRRVSIPFPTKMRVNTDLGQRFEELDAMVSANIIYPPVGMPEVTYIPPKSIIMNDMKWGETERDRKHRSVFIQIILQQLLLAAHMNNAARLDVYYSYPTSFMQGKAQLFMDLVQKEAIACAVKNTLVPSGKVKFFEMSEGQAAARLLANNETTRTCIIDIGGGTSDFFYVGKNKDGEARAIDTSVRFAARDIFGSAIYYLIKYCDGMDTFSFLAKKRNDIYSYDYLYIPVRDKVRQGKDKNEDKKFELNEFIVKLDDQLGMQAGTTNDGKYRNVGELYAEYLGLWIRESDADLKEIRIFSSLIAISIASIVHMAGMIVRKSKHPGNAVNLYFAGNGSKILDWLWFNQSINGRLFNDFLSHVFSESIKNTQKDSAYLKADFKPSNYEKKTEVAQGLLGSSLKHDGGNVKALKFKMNGESYCVKTSEGTKVFKSLDKFDSDAFNKRIVIDADHTDNAKVGDEEFFRFINAYNGAINTLNIEIRKRASDWGNGKSVDEYTLPKINFGEPSNPMDFNFDKSEWRGIRYSGIVPLFESLEDKFTFQGINSSNKDSKYVEEQNLFTIEIKALYGLIVRELVRHLKSDDYQTEDINITNANSISSREDFSEIDDFEDDQSESNEMEDDYITIEDESDDDWDSQSAQKERDFSRL